MTIIRACAAAITGLWMLIVASIAQAQDTQINYDAWEFLASRAERVISNPDTPTKNLEDFYASIVEWRGTFQIARDQNKSRLTTLQGQLDALGPVPENGAEPADIATLRGDLEALITELKAPRILAVEAYERADGLITEIDAILRDRETNKLLSPGPSPLLITNAKIALSELWAILANTDDEFAAKVLTKENFDKIAPEAINLGVLLLIGVVLFARGNSFVVKVREWISRRTSRGIEVWEVLISLGHLAIPLLGFILIVLALGAPISDTRIGGAFLQLPGAIWSFLVVRWIIMRLFNPPMGRPIFIAPAEDVKLLARGFYGLTAVMVAYDLGLAYFKFDQISPELKAFILLPVMVAGGLVIWGIARIIARTRFEETPDTVFRIKVFKIVGRFLRIVAFVVPVAAAFGYVELSVLVFYSTCDSLALASGLIILQKWLRDVYGLLIGANEDEQKDGLIPVLLGFFVALGSLPLFAISWGVREQDLLELWRKFNEGVSLGDSRISPVDFLMFVVIFAIGYISTRVLQSTLRTSILPKTRLDIGAQNAIVSGLGYVGIFLAALIAISSVGIDLSSLAIVAGALSVGIGFGLQNIVSNFVSGIILLIERPISEGDWIEVGGRMGYVRNISVRSTRIETFDRTDVIVPNTDLVSGVVTNYTRGNTLGRAIIPVGVAYGNDTRRVEAILREIAEAHPQFIASQKPNVLFLGFGADSLNFEIRGILHDINQVMAVKSEINHQINERFATEGIEIPFAQRDIWIRNPEALK